MSEPLNDKTREAVVEEALAYLKDKGFTCIVIAASQHDPENDMTYTIRRGFGDWYGRRGLAQSIVEYHQQKDELPKTVIDASRGAESD